MFEPFIHKSVPLLKGQPADGGMGTNPQEEPRLGLKFASEDAFLV